MINIDLPKTYQIHIIYVFYLLYIYIYSNYILSLHPIWSFEWSFRNPEITGAGDDWSPREAVLHRKSASTIP